MAFGVLISKIIGPIISSTGLTYEEALADCQTKGDIIKPICYTTLISFHANDYRVISGEVCSGIEEELLPTCYMMVASMTENPEMCDMMNIENEDDINHCKALASKDSVYCGNIQDPLTKKQCQNSLRGYD